MKNTSPFKLGIMVIFGFFIVIGIAVFALSKSNSSSGRADLTIWGTIDQEAFDALYNNSTLESNKLITVKYVKKNQADFDLDFVEALAEGTGPDVVILRDDYVYKHRNKLITIPYESYPERNFKDIFIEEGEVFLTKEGILSIPLMVDPIVMYWNRDMFSNNLVAQPPQYWDQIYELVEKMTRKDSSGNVLQSAIALGEWRNVSNAKEILSMLLLQAGNPIVQRSNQSVSSVLTQSFDMPVPPAVSTLNFYTQFSNPTSNSYTWNRSLPSSLNMFLGGNLAMYFGFASEIFSIQDKNSNLNFDVTYVPQTRNTNKKTVFARMYSMSITKQSKNPAAAFLAMNAMTEAKALESLGKLTNLPPVRRDMLSQRPTDAYRVVFYNSALISKTWIDPEPLESSQTFRDMIESVTSGKTRVSEAIGRAQEELNSQLR